MKVVVFAHTPPPHHGQSYMVELMLRGFEDKRFKVQCFHVNARFATDSHDIGRFRPQKAFQLLKYCAQAIWLRLNHGASNLYYVPAPTLRNSLIRDWIILLLCRPFFKNVIYHWHAAGLGEWVESLPPWMRRISHFALDKPELSISLGKFNEQDAALFRPKLSRLVPNGIPDPCPNFEQTVRHRRQRLEQRRTATAKNPAVVRVLYLGLCACQKGFLDAIHGSLQANESAKQRQLPLNFELTIAGPFLTPEDECAFRQTMERLGQPASIKYIGFVAGEAKTNLLTDSDILCFPTYYYAESFGLVIVEAMAHGMPALATRWRSVPDLFPPDYPGLVEIKSPDQIAHALIDLSFRDDSEPFRQRFLSDYTLEHFLTNLSNAFHTLAK